MKNSIDKKVILQNGFQIVFETPDDGYSYFFGYYDKKPLNESSTKLLAHRVSFDGRDVKDGDIAEVGYFDLQNNKFNKIDETLAWNWQQGSQLQWLPPTFDEKVIYNNIVDGKFVSIIYNLQTNEKNVIPFPIYVVHPNGKEALAVNYERHFWCRPGYNYQNIKQKKWDLPIHPEDGIFRINLEDGDISLILRTQDVVDVKPNKEILSSNNWLEHMMYNPTGSRFMFFHRWQSENIDHTRLFTANSSDGTDLFMFPDTRFYSHANWRNDRQLTIWTKEPKTDIGENKSVFGSLINKLKSNGSARKILGPVFNLMKPLLPKNMVEQIAFISKLLTYDDKTHNYSIVGDGILAGNGHITWSKNSDILLNDTYQDENSYRQLMFFNYTINECTIIGKFFSEYNECGYRADLHPRFGKSDNMIIVDSAHNLKRKIVVIEKVTK